MERIVLILCLFLCGCHLSTPKEGIKIGRIMKLAEEGVFSTTFEGELIRGGLVDGSGSMGGTFNFVIEEKSVKIIAQKAFEEQSEVIIHYETPLICSLLRSEHCPPHFVTKIDVVR